MKIFGIDTAGKTQWAAWCVALTSVFGLASVSCAQAEKPGKTYGLECESLVTPLGMDAKRPQLSWKIYDTRDGARQSAYQVQVGSGIGLLNKGKPDVWDSGRVASDQSRGIIYAGPALVPSRRYYWRVLTWDRDGKPYAPSDPTWWETGLLDQANWKAQWIGFEEPEERAVRESGAAWITNRESAVNENGNTQHDFRSRFDVKHTIRRAELYVTGQDTASAWLNGEKVVEASPLPPSGNLPWKKYEKRDVTGQIRSDKNLLAVEVTRYARRNQQPSRNPSQSPMSAVLLLTRNDGSLEIIKSGEPGWKASLNGKGNWQDMDFDDSLWADAVPYSAPASDFGSQDTGRASRTGTVKSLRRRFEIKKPIVSARIYATALGAYQLFLNGHKAGDQILAPGWTDFRQHAIYQTYDVTAETKPGENALAALLAPGWYATPLGWNGEGFNYGNTPPALRAQMRVEYNDGSVEWITTDESWKAEISPILSAEIYDGETYDARRSQPGWDTSSFDDHQWHAAELVKPHEPKVEWQYFQPIRIETTRKAKTITNPAPGVYVYDFAQNLSGVARVRARGAAGTDVKLRFAEILNADGTLYVENLRTAKATDHFILAGQGDEEFQPAFTYHGFRYVELSGVSAAPRIEDVTAVVFHTDAPFTATLKTGSPMLNQLWSNILWGQRSNFVGVPTDCPQRDERLGWSADAQVFWRAASYNMDLAAFSRKYASDLRGTQVGTGMYGIYAPGTQSEHPASGTGWSDAGVIVPWTSWIQTSDREIIEENWSAMEKYLAEIEAANPDFLWRKKYGIAFADWLAPEGVTPVDLIATAYWAYDATLMEQMAHFAGKISDEKKYADLFQKIRQAFNKAYVRDDGFVGGVPPPPVFASGTATKLGDTAVETQTGYVLALHMNLLNGDRRQMAGQRLLDRIAANHGQLGTGFLGTPYLLAALTETGHTDVAYRLLESTEYPSWGYLVDHGATTMWERWNGDQMRGDPSMNSYNHYAYGAVADWIYRYAAGIDTLPDDPGFHTILLHPNFDRRLGSLDFSYESAYGTIHSAWTISGELVAWNLTIPPNAKGELPVSADQIGSFKLAGQPLAQSARIHPWRQADGNVWYEVPAGTYEFTVTLR